MDKKKVPFVFANQIYYMSSENNIVTVVSRNGTVYLCANIEAIQDNEDLLLKLVAEIYHALF
jgi:DNA-binding LytR/AlgR family response regulator